MPPMALPRVVAVAVTAAEAQVPEHFRDQLQCPFSKLWIEHGAEKAAEILGSNPEHARRLGAAALRGLAEEKLFGSCSYKNQFGGGGDVCYEYHGGWTGATAKADCDKVRGGPGAMAAGKTCTEPPKFAGYCVTSDSNGKKKNSMALSPGMMSTCNDVKNACSGFMSGTFEGAGDCKDMASSGDAAAIKKYKPDEYCAIGPGPMGAAHMHGSSPGYNFSCAGLPSESSPYQWPLRWKAHMHSLSYNFGSDVPISQRKSLVWYRSDKNWKRSDTYWAWGNASFDGDSGNSNSINGSARNSTMLHRGTRMVFIDWADNKDTVANCTWLDLGLVGNIRPDWFMDKMGAATDVQYLGDEHIYWKGKPTLVKKWRKIDFADHYFTMSMQRLPGADGVHWPLTLNIPGEGLGPDGMQHYWDHEIIGEDETPFLLDVAYEKSGGKCTTGGGGGGGPPTNTSGQVPSNLHMKPESWRSIEYTFSPVWKGFTRSGSGMSGEAVGPPAGLAMDSTSGVGLELCVDNAAVKYSLSIKTSTPKWLALQFLSHTDTTCKMTPAGGGDGEVVYVKVGSNGAASEHSLHHGPLPASLKQFQTEKFLTGLKPFPGAATDLSNGLVEHSNGQTQFSFHRAHSGAVPSKVRVAFAVGDGPVLGYHKHRGCMEVDKLPKCGAKTEDPCPKAKKLPAQ